MPQIPLTSIVVGERFRKEFGDLAGLAASLARHGQLHPLIIREEDNLLLSGERRYRAAQSLGWTEIWCEYRSNIDELARREIELEENLHRHNFTWQEEAALVREIHEVKIALYGEKLAGNTSYDSAGWGLSDTAESVESTKYAVIRRIQVANALDFYPALAECKSVEDANRVIEKALDLLLREQSLRKLRARGHLPGLANSDCREWLPTIETASVDLVLIDPPYGVNMNTDRGGGVKGVWFDDTTKGLLELFEEIVSELRRVAKPDAHLYCFTSNLVFPEMTSILEKGGFFPDYVPLIWAKNTIGQVNWEYRYGPQYEQIIFCTADGRRLARQRGNVFHYDTVHGGSRLNPFEKPQELLSELIEMSTREGEVVLDCFAGSGSTIVAAHKLGRKGIGCEVSKEEFEAAAVWLANEGVGR